MMFDPQSDWTAIRPGLISLPTTDYEIEHILSSNTYILRWRSGIIGETATLTFAKSQVQNHMRDIISMGYEP